MVSIDFCFSRNSQRGCLDRQVRVKEESRTVIDSLPTSDSTAGVTKWCLPGPEVVPNLFYRTLKTPETTLGDEEKEAKCPPSIPGWEMLKGPRPRCSSSDTQTKESAVATIFLGLFTGVAGPFWGLDRRIDPMPPSWLPVVCWPSPRFRDLEKRHPDLCLRVRGAFAPCAGLCPKFPSFARAPVILREGPSRLRHDLVFTSSIANDPPPKSGHVRRYQD